MQQETQKKHMQTGQSQKGHEFVGEREMVFSSVDGKDPVSIHRVNPPNCNTNDDLFNACTKLDALMKRLILSFFRGASYLRVTLFSEKGTSIAKPRSHKGGPKNQL